MNKKMLLIVIPMVLLLLAPGVYFYAKYRAATSQLTKSAVINKEDATKLIAKISLIMELPSDEEPTIATVTDKEKLKGQNFFAKAENDDKVLIYAKAQKAILYRPSSNKVIEVSRIDATPPVATESATTKVVPAKSEVSSKVVIYNGTQTTGLSQLFIDKVGDKVTMDVTKKINASKNDYAKSIVVDLSKKTTLDAHTLASVLGTDVSNSMPEGEATPSADILVILGADFVK